MFYFLTEMIHASKSKMLFITTPQQQSLNVLLTNPCEKDL